VNQNDPQSLGHTYSEEDWNPITPEQALLNPGFGYRASKTFAERAAWDFVKNEKPNFTLTVLNPPLVLGPIVHYLNSLDALNTSNENTRNFIQGKAKEEIPATPVPLWIDVRDLALAHVKAIELEEAQGMRFFATAGYYTNREILEIVRKNFLEYKDNLPAESVQGGGMPEGGFAKLNNERTKKVLGIKFRSLEESIVDLVKSLQKVGV
jgi:nucleoside-diphosphate-sugar epimerase